MPDGFLVALSRTPPPVKDGQPRWNEGKQTWVSGYFVLRGSRDIRDLFCSRDASTSFWIGEVMRAGDQLEPFVSRRARSRLRAEGQPMVADALGRPEPEGRRPGRTRRPARLQPGRRLLGRPQAGARHPAAGAAAAFVARDGQGLKFPKVERSSLSAARRIGRSPGPTLCAWPITAPPSPSTRTPPERQ